jgi:hypothetical protein
MLSAHPIGLVNVGIKVKTLSMVVELPRHYRSGHASF